MQIFTGDIQARGWLSIISFWMNQYYRPCIIIWMDPYLAVTGYRFRRLSILSF